MALLALETQLESDDEIEDAADHVAGNLSLVQQSRNVTESGAGKWDAATRPLCEKDILQHVPIVSHCHHHRANFMTDFLSQRPVLVGREVSCAKPALPMLLQVRILDSACAGVWESRWRSVKCLSCTRWQCKFLCEIEGSRERFSRALLRTEPF